MITLICCLTSLLQATPETGFDAVWCGSSGATKKTNKKKHLNIRSIYSDTLNDQKVADT